MADTPQELPNWIAAISTALTAIGGGIAAWFGLYQSVRSRMPTVEASAHWGPTIYGRFVQVDLVIRNRIRETLILESDLAPENVRCEPNFRELSWTRSYRAYD